MCNACLHPSKASCRTVTYRSLISHVVLFKMLVEVQDCKGAATQGKIASKKSRKERRTKAEDLGRCCEDRIRGQRAPYVSILSSGSNSYAVLSRLLPGCVSETQSSGRLPLPGSCQRLGEPASSAHLCSSLIAQILQRSFVFLIFFSFSSDLDHFKVHTRSAVSVREGQGVVLLCGTPTSSGGELSGPSALAAAEDDFGLN